MTKKDRQSALFEAIFKLAELEGNEAAKNAVCVPMIVQQHSNVMDDNSPVEKSWFVEDGVCGFAWVTVRPGNSPFANWIKKTNRGSANSYEGGVTVRTGLMSQSLTRNEAFAHAFAKVLQSKGINAVSNSRID